jgi:hypothetical protein
VAAEDLELHFLAELKRWIEEQPEDKGLDISCELSPYHLTIYYRGKRVGAWRATREGARWHGPHDRDAGSLAVRNVHDAIEIMRRALFLFVRDAKDR